MKQLSHIATHGSCHGRRTGANTGILGFQEGGAPRRPGIIGLAELAPPERSERALTVLEMLVATTLLSLIIVGLTAMFVQTQRAFKLGLKQNDVNDAGRTVVDMITHDISQMADAQHLGITNVYFDWSLHPRLVQKVQSGLITEFFTNELDDIYFLVHTNNTWMGVGYFVIDQAPGVGTLYRYTAMTNTVPAVFSNSLFQPYIFLLTSSLKGATNVNSTGLFYPIADGVTHLKLRTYDQNGNEPVAESFYESLGGGIITYPLTPFGQSVAPFGQYSTNVVTNTLPHFVQLEVGVLEPETYSQMKALSGNFNVQSNFLINAAGQTHIFRQQLIIPAVQR